MLSGLLWYGGPNEPPLTATIADAAKRYREKFGYRADTCYVNPAQFAEQFQTTAGFQVPPALNLTVLPKNTISPNYVWLGRTKPAPTPAQIEQFEQARQAAVETQAPRVATLVKLISGAESDGSDALDNRPRPERSDEAGGGVESHSITRLYQRRREESRA